MTDEFFADHHPLLLLRCLSTNEPSQGTTLGKIDEPFSLVATMETTRVKIQLPACDTAVNAGHLRYRQ